MALADSRSRFRPSTMFDESMAALVDHLASKGDQEGLERFRILGRCLIDELEEVRKTHALLIDTPCIYCQAKEAKQ